VSRTSSERPAWWIALLAAGLGAVALAAAAEDRTGPTLVVVVRHAEKRADRVDPGLTAAGVRRSEALARILAPAGVGRLYCSQFRRTCDTLAPLARRLGLEPTVVPLDADLAAGAATLARRVLAENPGGVAVVAGHSNTVPALLAAFGVADVPEIHDGDYDDLFVLSLTGGTTPGLLHLAYGDPTPP